MDPREEMVDIKPDTNTVDYLNPQEISLSSPHMMFLENSALPILQFDLTNMSAGSAEVYLRTEPSNNAAALESNSIDPKPVVSSLISYDESTDTAVDIKLEPDFIPSSFPLLQFSPESDYSINLGDGNLLNSVPNVDTSDTETNTNMGVGTPPTELSELVKENLLYQVILPGEHDLELLPFIDDGYFLLPTDLVASPSEASDTDSSSGVSSLLSPSQSSDEINSSQGTSNGLDDRVYGDFEFANVEVPDFIHHEETVSSTGSGVELKPKLESQMSDYEYENHYPTHYMTTPIFTKEELSEAYDDGEEDVVDGPLPVQRAICEDQANFCASSSEQMQNYAGYYNQFLVTSDKHLSDSVTTGEENPAKAITSKKRRYQRRSTASSSDESTGKAEGKKRKVSTRSGNPVVTNARKAKSSTDRSKLKVSRAKDNVTSFRFQMGSHLRVLSAVLEITGMKQASDFIPYDIIRRFHPTDMYRTIDKSIAYITGWEKYDDNVEPDWFLLLEANSGTVTWMPVSEETRQGENDATGCDARVYYKSPFGFHGKAGPHCVVSFRRDLEDNGMLKEFPSILTTLGSAQLNAVLNLHSVAENCLNTEFKESNSNEGPLLMRLKHPKCTGLLYKFGKLIVVGVKSYDEFRTAARKFARMVQKTGVNVTLTHLKMHYYIGLIKLPFNINVEAMKHHEYLSKFISFESHVFSGVIIKMNDSPMLCLVFDTGAVLMTEAVREEDMKNALDKIYPCLRLFGYQR